MILQCDVLGKVDLKTTNANGIHCTVKNAYAAGRRDASDGNVANRQTHSRTNRSRKIVFLRLSFRVWEFRAGQYIHHT